MKKSGYLWEYMAVCVDDRVFVLHDLQEFVDQLIGKYKYKLKGTNSMCLHLGCDFFRDEYERLCMAPKEYTEKMINGNRICSMKHHHPT